MNEFAPEANIRGVTQATAPLPCYEAHNLQMQAPSLSLGRVPTLGSYKYAFKMSVSFDPPVVHSRLNISERPYISNDVMGLTVY